MLIEDSVRKIPLFHSFSVSHFQKMHGILEKAWDAEGSPFRGTPFDPSKLNISPPGDSNLG